MQLDQVKAIVTGGVSGLGLAVAHLLAARGASVALVDINDEKGASAVAELGAKASYHRTDVTSEEHVAASLQQAADRMGGLNAAINCAGILGAGRVLGKEGPMPLKTFQTTVMVNLIGSFNVAKAAAALMQNNAPGEDGERGVIVNTASIAAYEGQIGQAAYAASKGGVIGMTLPMAREFARIGGQRHGHLPRATLGRVVMLVGVTQHLVGVQFPRRDRALVGSAGLAHDK